METEQPLLQWAGGFFVCYVSGKKNIPNRAVQARHRCRDLLLTVAAGVAASGSLILLSSETLVNLTPQGFCHNAFPILILPAPFSFHSSLGIA